MEGIYIIKNTQNNFVYVGQSKNIEYRWRQHKSNFKHNKHHNIYMQRIYNKYGPNIFEYKIIEKCNDTNNRETYWLNYYYPNVYNLGATGNAHNCSDITKLKISKAMKGKMVGSLNPNFGNKWSIEEREKISNSVKKSFKNNPKIKEKLSIIAKNRVGSKNPFYGKHHSEETKLKIAKKVSKKILCVETGIVYNSTMDVERKIGAYHSDISKICNGSRKGSIHGFHWRYV